MTTDNCTQRSGNFKLVKKLKKILKTLLNVFWRKKQLTLENLNIIKVLPKEFGRHRLHALSMRPFSSRPGLTNSDLEPGAFLNYYFSFDG